MRYAWMTLLVLLAVAAVSVPLQWTTTVAAGTLTVHGDGQEALHCRIPRPTAGAILRLHLEGPGTAWIDNVQVVKVD